MTTKELQRVLEKHGLWLRNMAGGERADLRGADLRDANLSYANLSGANLSGANLSGANLSGANLSDANLSDANLSDANLSDANLRYANLRYANLRYANLCGADLCGADLDFSCLPLWCGSLQTNFDDRQIIQFIYHAVKAGLNSINTSDDIKTRLRQLIDLANEFHRVDECGRIEYDG